MKANELRINNYILTDRGVTIIIGINPYKTGNYKPIPLTEQWAEDFGFELNENRTLFSKCIEREGAFFTYNIMFTAKGYWIIIHRSQGGVTEKMNIGHYNFVHQFQNLWFALEKKELLK